MILVVTNLFLCYLAINKIGMIVIESEILREGNENLLNNLDEGVIIQQEDSKEILFQNTAATLIQK